MKIGGGKVMGLRMMEGRIEQVGAIFCKVAQPKYME
jgi:hypothetical protein